jgi:hypothetical protein
VNVNAVALNRGFGARAEWAKHSQAFTSQTGLYLQGIGNFAKPLTWETRKWGVSDSTPIRV